MKKREMFDVLLKAMGIWFLGYAFLYLQSFVFLIFMLFDKSSAKFTSPVADLVVSVVGMLLPCLAGLFLLRYSNVISSKIIKNEQEINLNFDKDCNRDIFSVALKVMGIVCLTKGIPQMVQSLLSFQGEIGIMIGNPNVYSALVYIVIGIYLVRWGKFIINFAFCGRQDINN